MGEVSSLKNKIAISKIGEAVADLRKTPLGDAENHRAPTEAIGDQNAHAMPSLRVDGNPTPNPAELNNIDYVDSGDQLRRNLHGGPLFGEELRREEVIRDGIAGMDVAPKSTDPESIQTPEYTKRLNSERKLDFSMGASSHLSSYVRDWEMHSLREGVGL